MPLPVALQAGFGAAWITVSARVLEPCCRSRG